MLLPLLTALGAVAALAVAPPPPVRYVALGDSTGVGVGAGEDGGYVARLFGRLRERHPGARLVNLCVSGARAADVLERQLQRALAERPTVVTLGVGINDATGGTPPEVFAREYDRIAAALERTGARVVVVNLPDLSLSPLATSASTRLWARGRTQALNAAIAGVARRHGFVLADLFDASERALPHHPELFSADRFHPSALGYDVWADAMWPALEAAAASRG